MVYMYHSFLIQSSADGHLGCFHVLAIINSAVMKKKKRKYIVFVKNVPQYLTDCRDLMNVSSQHF